MVNWKWKPCKLAARGPSHTKLTLTSNLIGYLVTGQLPFQTYFPVISSLSTYALSRSLFIITHLARPSQLLSLHPLRLYGAVHLLSNTHQKRIHLITHTVLDCVVRPTRSTLIHDLQWTT